MVGGTHRDSWAAGVGCVECANPRNGLVYVWGDACPMAFLTNPFTPACPYSLEDAQHSTFGSLRLPKPHQANSSGAREHRRAARTQVSRAVSFADRLRLGPAIVVQHHAALVLPAPRWVHAWGRRMGSGCVFLPSPNPLGTDRHVFGHRGWHRQTSVVLCTASQDQHQQNPECRVKTKH